MRPIAYISCATLDSERHWTPLDLEAGSMSGLSNAFEDTSGARSFASSRITRRSKASAKWETTMRESSGGSRVSHRVRLQPRVPQGQRQRKCRFPVPFARAATEHDRPGSGSVIPVEDGGIFLIRACGLHTRASRIPGVVLSGLVPHSERCFGWTPFRLFGFSRLSHTRATYED